MCIVLGYAKSKLKDYYHIILVPDLLLIESLMKVTAATNKNLDLHQGRNLSRRFVLPFKSNSHPYAGFREVPQGIPGLANQFLNKYCRPLQTNLNSSMN
jgi:hypothetical protein